MDPSLRTFRPWSTLRPDHRASTFAPAGFCPGTGRAQPLHAFTVVEGSSLGLLILIGDRGPSRPAAVEHPCWEGRADHQTSPQIAIDD